MSQPRRVTLGITQRNGRFRASLRSDLQPDAVQISIDVTTEDLRRLNEELTDILEDLTRTVMRTAGNGPEIPDDVRNQVHEECHWLAERGYWALTYIFGDSLALLRDQIGPTPGVILDIDSEFFVFPWELLYDGYEPNELDYNGFWGFRYVIHRYIPPAGGRQVPAPEIDVDFPVDVGLLADQELSNVARVEVPFLQGLHDEQHIRLLLPHSELNALERGATLDGELRRFFGQRLQIFHFACHTRGPVRRREPRDEYCLLLSRDFPLWPSDFPIWKLKFSGDPLVILNACGTSPRDPHRTWNMVRVLLRYGARGVVATECIVPDSVAAAFTKRFYPLLLEGRELGEALCKARKSLLEDHHNPLGLLYALYAFPHTRFVIAHMRRS